MDDTVLNISPVVFLFGVSLFGRTCIIHEPLLHGGYAGVTGSLAVQWWRPLFALALDLDRPQNLSTDCTSMGSELQAPSAHFVRVCMLSRQTFMGNPCLMDVICGILA